MLKKLPKIAQQAQDLCLETIEALGYDLVETRYQKEGPDYHLTFFCDRRGGMSLDDCEKISLAIDPLLDEGLNVPQPYLMSVSSPGLDRPLETEKDFLRHIDDEIEISLYAQFRGEQKPTGILKAYEAGTLVVDIGGEEVRFEPGTYSKVKQAIRF